LNKKHILYFWASDLRKSTGEGILANQFLQDLKKYNQNFKLININKNQLNYNSFCHKYFFNFFGAIKLWNFYNKGYKTAFINYLPIWNFLVFFILPPKTILGPITGSLVYNKSSFLDYLTRGLLLNIFKSISLKIIFFRNKKILFSTELLKYSIKKNNLKKCYFNYVLKLFEGFKKSKKKKIDFLIYHRLHRNKNNKFIKDFIINSSNKKYKITVVGDPIYLKNVNNLGYVSRKKIKNLLEISKFTFGSTENLYTLFVLDAISRSVTIFYDKKLKRYNTKIKYYKLLPVNFDDTNKTTKYIMNKSYNLKKNIKKNFMKTHECDQYFNQ